MNFRDSEVLLNQNAPLANWQKTDNLSKKNGPHATVYLTNGDSNGKTTCDMVLKILILGKGTHSYKKNGQRDKRHGFGTLSVPAVAIQADKVPKSSLFGSDTKPKKTPKTPRMVKVYTGAWAEDVRHGTGSYYYDDGSVYEGSWVGDMRQGWGVMTYADGSAYEGEWHHEMRHGQGNGDRYEGMWFDDEKEGPGTFIYLSKRQVYKGEWSRGQPRCGTIENMETLAGFNGPKYDIPPIELEDPRMVLESEKELLYEARAMRLVGME